MEVDDLAPWIALDDPLPKTKRRGVPLHFHLVECKRPG